MKYPRTNNAYHKSRRDNSDRIDALLAECEKMEDELAAQGKLERELAAVTEQRDRMQSKIENQAERIKYLEGATNHATGTPLSKMREQLDRLAEQKESNHKVTIAIGRMFYEVKEQRDRLAEAGKILAEEYEDRRSQWGGEYLWQKYEDAERVDAAIAVFTVAMEGGSDE